jgi:hypothetical protein
LINNQSARRASNASDGRLLRWLLFALSGGSLAVLAFVVNYGILISPFLVVGVIVLVVLEKRRVKLDAPVRFPRRSTLQPRADS